MKTYNIWREGYLTTGMEGIPFKATFVGKATGSSFRDAVLRYFRCYPSQSFNPDNLTDWGCSLFDNEQDARKTFG